MSERTAVRALALLDRAPVAFYRVRLRPSVHLEQCSSDFWRFTGYQPDDFLHDPALIWRFVHPDDRPAVRAVMSEPAQAPAHSPIRLVHRDGRILTVEHVVFVS